MRSVPVPPKTIAPSRPLPSGSASCQSAAGLSYHITGSAAEAWVMMRSAAERDWSRFTGEGDSDGIVFLPPVADRAAVEQSIGLVVVAEAFGGGIEVE